MLLVVGISGCTEEESSDLYVNEEYGISFNPPEGWIDNTDENTLFIVSFVIRPEDFSGAVCGIMKPYHFTDDENFSEYIENDILGFNDYIPDFEILSETETEINGMNAYEVVGTYTYTEAEDFPMKSKSTYVEKNRKCYVINYVAYNDDYDTYLSIVEDSINSFTII